MQTILRLWIMLLLAAPLRLTQAADLEFFEKRIRPVLVAECYQCHSGDRAKGGLRVDYRGGLVGEGNAGVVVPGDPARSRLLRALRHEDPELKMPKDGAQLDAAIIADFEKWIAAGAPDPRERPGAAPPPVSWESTLAFRKQWWSFQPVADPPIPLAGNSWSSHPIDRFLLARMRDKGLAPARPADRRTVIRRLYFALTGLPPTPEQMRDGLNKAHAALVDELLNSRAFGERWARHWMDWFRYAESHGSEGDPRIPHIHLYRDYLIRALNADVPYDQLVREHIAGDLLENPRINRELGLNESAIGIAHFRLVQHGYQPTEPMMELVRFTDDQVDVLSKALLGLTVSCARCHNHKFDPISQKDYYALFGILRSAMPGIISVDAPGRLEVNRDRLAELKRRIREKIADEWLRFAEQTPDLLRGKGGTRGERWKAAIKAATAGNLENPFVLWNRLAGRAGEDFARAWTALAEEQKRREADFATSMETRFRKGWDADGIRKNWFGNGIAWRDPLAPAGEFFIQPSGTRVIAGIYPRGVYSHRQSDKDGGVLVSPRFKLTSDSISLRLMGHDGAQARLVVGNYPVPRGGIYGQRSQPRHERFVWYKWDTTYWKGEEAHIEVATQDDLMIFVNAYRGDKKPNLKDGRSYIGISDVVFNDSGQQTPREASAALSLLLEGNPPADAGALAGHYRDVIHAAVNAWKLGRMNDRQAALLNYLLQEELLPNSVFDLQTISELLAEYRRLEAEIPVATRSSGVLETEGIDQPLLDRGDYRRPTEPVPRRFLEVFGARPYDTPRSGRRELAEDILRPDNPLVPRVLVNRVWAYLFGEGLVRSVDNFGRLGRKPDQPELLDHLARWFVDNGYSLKKLIAYMTKTRAYQMDSRASAEAMRVDPANRLLSHFPVRRLDAEAIRDAILAVSGRLDRRMYGESVPGTTPRRSLYVRSPRNNRDEFLKTFDAPEPLSTRGKRDVTNVPAQALALLNSPLVKESAAHLGGQLAGRNGPFDERVAALFATALGRPVKNEELRAATVLRDRLLERGRELATKRSLLESRLELFRNELEAIAAPVRKSLLARRGKGEADAIAGPRPWLLWDFEKSADERLTGLKGELKGNARIEDGALVVDGRLSYAITEKLPRKVSAKTLEAWVQLDDLNQRGGGVVSIMTPDGVHFDAIVFGERSPRRWLAGSDHFRRTRPFNGPAETESGPVHVAIVYEADGTIRAYRNGEPYGEAYPSNGPRAFNPGSTVVAFGLRHLKAGGNRLLKGRILEARLYDRALSAAEVAASAGQASAFVSDRQLLAAMPAESRARIEGLKKQIAKAQNELESLASVAVPDEHAVWSELAHAVFNLKEFIYLR